MRTKRKGRGRRVLRQYTAQDREGWIAKFKESGQSKREFCERTGLNLNTFYNWTSGMVAKPGKKKFAEVRVQPVESVPLEVRLPNGVAIRFQDVGDRPGVIELIRGIMGNAEGSSRC